MNNTSLFFVLEVDDVRLLFPGDSQHGAWEHVLNDPYGRALVEDVAFYKISHHGSHNGTPKRYLEEVLHEGRDAMLPWGLVKAWEKTIPLPELLTLMSQRKHRVIRANEPKARRGKVTVNGDLWSEDPVPGAYAVTAGADGTARVDRTTCSLAARLHDVATHEPGQVVDAQPQPAGPVEVGEPADRGEHRVGEQARVLVADKA